MDDWLLDCSCDVLESVGNSLETRSVSRYYKLIFGPIPAKTLSPGPTAWKNYPLVLFWPARGNPIYRSSIVLGMAIDMLPLHHRQVQHAAESH